jgi:hypothetical protein
MRARGREALALFGVLLFASLFVTIPTSAQEPGAGVMQSDDAKNLTYEQNRMYMYGNNNDGGSPDMWPMWTHSAATDTESDDSIGESNVVGDPNNGGGPRSFTFEGTHPVEQATGIDNSMPIAGKVKLAIFCDLESGQCSKQVDIVLRLGNRDLAVQTIAEPDADNFYAFEFFVNDDEIPAGEAFGLRVTFQKPSTVLAGYTLYLGNGNSYMDIPVLPPYQESVPGLDNLDGYVSPYSQASGYSQTEAHSTSIVGLVIWGVLAISVFVCGFMFIPPIPLRELSILFTGLGLLVSMLVAPAIAGPFEMGQADPDDPDIWTIEELSQLEEREGTFLGDALVEGYTFTLYAEYDQIYTAKDGAETISGLGFESDAELLGDSETSRRGREYVQLFFSLFHMDLSPGQAVSAEISIVNSTDPATGQNVMLPLHAAHENANKQIVTVTVDGEDSIRYAIPHEVSTLIGVKSTWGSYAHIATALGILMGGIGFWMSFRQHREYDLENANEELVNEEFEDALDDFEEF